MDIHDKSNPPEPRPCKQCGQPGNVVWQKALKDTRGTHRKCLRNVAYWSRLNECHRCRALRMHHNITWIERKELFSHGCAIVGCEREPTAIDHDHNVCPQETHSCEKCRRGVLCYYHNSIVVMHIDRLRMGDYDDALDYLGLSVEFRETK